MPARFAGSDALKTIIAYRNGAPVRLRDVGSVSDGVEDSRVASWLDRQPAIILDIKRRPGANVVDTVNRIRALLPSKCLTPVQLQPPPALAGEAFASAHPDALSAGIVPSGRLKTTAQSFFTARECSDDLDAAPSYCRILVTVGVRRRLEGVA
jgi:hypothetical protein